MTALLTTVLKEARALDREDPLQHFRERFEQPSGIVYLDGNSLGAMPCAAKSVMADAVNRQWSKDLIRSWNDNQWINAPKRIGAKISRLVGADPDEVIVADSVSVNIFKLLSAICRNRPNSKRIISEAGSFPTDAHVASGVADAMGLTLDLVPRSELLDHLDHQTAVLLLSHVHYKSGARFDMASVNVEAARHEIPVVWDLSHSTGAVPLHLHEDQTQYAVGCGYKYLNGGPGAPAFIFVRSDRQEALQAPLQGWMGHSAPFAFDDAYQPAAGMGRFLVGTPPILSLLALESGVDEFADVDMKQVWQKSRSLFQFLVGLMAKHCPQLKLMTPTDECQRGSHASFSSPDAWPINNALIARGIIGDFRTPDVLRFGLTPLYTGFEDIAHAVAVLNELLTTGVWNQPEYRKSAVVT